MLPSSGFRFFADVGSRGRDGPSDIDGPQTVCVLCSLTHTHTHSNTKICGPPAALAGEGGFGEEAQVGDGRNIASRFALLVVPFLAGRGPAADD